MGSQRRNERGASATEYALLIVGIAAVLVLVIFAFGDNVTDLFTGACGELAAQTGDPC